MTDSQKPEASQIPMSGLRFLRLFWPLGLLICISVAISPQSWLQLPAGTRFFWGGMAAGLLAVCLFMPQRHYLRLSQAGLEIQYLYHRRSFSWREIENFRLKQGPLGFRQLVFDFSEAAASPHRLLKAAAGYDVSLLDYFELSAEQLLTQLQLWQSYYGKYGKYGQLRESEEPVSAPQSPPAG